METQGNADIRAKFVEQLQSTNQLLRRQAIVILIASFIMYALMDFSQTQWNRNQDMYNKIRTLELLRDAQDLRSYLQEHKYNLEISLMHEIDTDALFYRMESSKYSDRQPIIEAISTLKDRRRSLWGISEKTINISGVSVPISTWFYLVPIVIFALFHNFTQIISYRHKLLMKFSSIEDWEQGPYLAGFRNAHSLDTPSRYLDIISSIIVPAFLIFPLLVSFLFIMASYNLTSDYDRASSDIVLAINWIFLILLVIDVAIIMRQENILKFRDITELFIMDRRNIHRENEPKSKADFNVGKIVVWFCIPVIIFLLHYFTQLMFDHSNGIVPIYLFSASSMTCVLPLALVLRLKYSSSRFLRGMTFVGVIIFLFWISIPPLVWFDFLRYTHANPYEIVELSVALIIGATILSIFYIKLVGTPSK